MNDLRNEMLHRKATSRAHGPAFSFIKSSQSDVNTWSRDGRNLLPLAVLASERGDPEATEKWSEILTCCSRRNQSIESLVFDDQYLYEKSPAERLLASSDWASKILIFESIQDGSYLDGRILRTSQGMYEVKDGTKSGYGVEKSTLAIYCGQFQDGKKHGNGRQIFINKDGYEGEWQNGRPYGWGTMYPPGHPKDSRTGLFHGYLFLGNPHDKPKGIIERFIGFAKKTGLKTPQEER